MEPPRQPRPVVLPRHHIWTQVKVGSFQILLRYYLNQLPARPPVEAPSIRLSGLNCVKRLPRGQ
jgi:hypothetical protein